MTESRASRFARDWNHIKDDRKIRGWDYQANERKDRDFPHWASTPVEPEAPVELVGVETVSIPALLTSEGRTLFNTESIFGSAFPVEDEWDAEKYIVLFDNVGDRRVMVKETNGDPDSAYADYGFLFRIVGINNPIIPSNLQLGGIMGSGGMGGTGDREGDWWTHPAPTEEFKQGVIAEFESFGVQLQYIGIGAIIPINGTAELKFAD